MRGILSIFFASIGAVRVGGCARVVVRCSGRTLWNFQAEFVRGMEEDGLSQKNELHSSLIGYFSDVDRLTIL
jgi:hypothetical protein